MSSLIRAYKVFEEKDRKPYFMFHGVDGSREVPLDRVLYCTRRRVRDGTGKRWYMSAFHVYLDRTVLQAFLSTLKINRGSRYVVEVLAFDPRPKHERSRASLTDKLVVTAREWQNRVPVGEF